ncbi:MAG: YciI family protein [Thermoplasmata archaeon]
MPKEPRIYFLVYSGPGPNWDASRARREQAKWEEHAAFMDALVDDEFVVLGGPVDPTHAVLLIDAPDEHEVEARLSKDPWGPMGILEIQNIARWEILLDSRERP